MNTLTSSPCAEVVARLFDEADASAASLAERRPSLHDSEWARLMTSTEGYQAFYMSLKDSVETLARELPETVDLVLLDGAKGLYPKVLSLLEPRLSEGALVVADNADWCPEYLARVRDPGGGYVSVPFASDVEVSMRLGGRAVAVSFRRGGPRSSLAPRAGSATLWPRSS
jgi:hypothetical protein